MSTPDTKSLVDILTGIQPLLKEPGWFAGGFLWFCIVSTTGAWEATPIATMLRETVDYLNLWWPFASKWGMWTIWMSMVAFLGTFFLADVPPFGSRERRGPLYDFAQFFINIVPFVGCFYFGLAILQGQNVAFDAAFNSGVFSFMAVPITAVYAVSVAVLLSRNLYHRGATIGF